ncbi:MAG: hypothetical protein ACI7YS_15780, partial [Flavobacterium sp.]
MSKKWIYIGLFIGFLLNPWVCFSFNLTVTPTAETCSGNGSLTFAVSDTDPNGSIIFFIYKLPNTIVPVATTSANSLTGVSSGDYLVEAKETVGNMTTTQQASATIISNIVPLAYAVKTLNQACSTTSNISIETISGTAATYQIISGPVLFPAQPDNSFKNLPTGTYKIKVVDVCGNSVVQNFTVTLSPTSIQVSPPQFSDLNPVDCDKIKVSQTITPAPGTIIGYPISIRYELTLPGNTTPTIITKTVSSGDLLSQEISEIFPNFINQGYPYNITITDACGTTYPINNFQVSQQTAITGGVLNLQCDEYGLELNATNFASPYFLNFDSAPAAFNPNDYDSTYPGSYTTGSLLFGDLNHSVTFGDYTVTLTDACNRIATTNVKVVSKPPYPSVWAVNNGCLTDSGQIRIEVPGYKIVTAIITSAPAGYSTPLPHDISAIVNSDGVLLLNPMPLGDYVFNLTDNCGNILPSTPVTVPIYADMGVFTDLRPGCDLGKASVLIASNNGKLKSVIITDAPPSFPFSLPYNASENITNGIGAFYMGNLSGGDYTFNTVDECNFTSQTALTLEGYTITNNYFALVPNCGSYDIPLDYVSNIKTTEGFWLQKQLPSGAWGHPVSTIAYPEGSAPNETNSLNLLNNTTNYNLTYNGTFRIVHYFLSYNNGKNFNDGLVQTTNKICLEILSPTMSFDHALEIVDVCRMPCNATGNPDVVVMANGTPPLLYSIVDTAGNIMINNGNSNIFSNLPVGIYRFQVEDSCGNAVISTFDVSDLVSLAKIYPTCGLSLCVPSFTGTETFDLTSLNSTILGNQNPAHYTLNYYTSLSNAQAGTNVINNPGLFIPTSNPQTLYIRLVFTALPNCYETGSFELNIGLTPKLNLKSTYKECDQTPVVVNAGSGNLATTGYLWSNGNTSPSIMVTQVGVTNLSVTATNVFGLCDNEPLTCSANKDIKVIISDIPEIKA